MASMEPAELVDAALALDAWFKSQNITDYQALAVVGYWVSVALAEVPAEERREWLAIVAEDMAADDEPSVDKLSRGE
jgi:hypothetical protein